MKKLLLVPLALLGAVFLLGVMFAVLSFAPPLLSAVSLGVLAVVAAWWFFGRKTSGASESSLLRQSSKEGLL